MFGLIKIEKKLLCFLFLSFSLSSTSIYSHWFSLSINTSADMMKSFAKISAVLLVVSASMYGTYKAVNYYKNAPTGRNVQVNKLENNFVSQVSDYINTFFAVVRAAKKSNKNRDSYAPMKIVHNNSNYKLTIDTTFWDGNVVYIDYDLKKDIQALYAGTTSLDCELDNTVDNKNAMRIAKEIVEKMTG